MATFKRFVRLFLIAFVSVVVSGEVISTSLYCGFENSFYKTGETWSDQCYNYNCSSDGVFAKLSQQCPPPAEREPTEQCTPVVEPTDRQSCCTDELFCDQLPPRDGGSSPAAYNCPDGWSRLAAGGKCVMLHQEPLSYEDARQFCFTKAAFLADVEECEFCDVENIRLHPGMLAAGAFWTGLRSDGTAFLWEKESPRIPKFNYFCPESWVTTSAYWGCDYETHWSKARHNERVCAGARAHNSTSNKLTIKQVLVPCEDRLPFICVGDFKESRIFRLLPNRACDDGWRWNPLTRFCIKYIESAMARPSYFAAIEDCADRGGNLYDLNSKEKEFLLYEIMKSRNVKPYSVWIKEYCVEVVSPYIAGTRDLNSIKKRANCHLAKPYVCEQQPKPMDVTKPELSLNFATKSLVCSTREDDSYPGLPAVINPGGDATQLSLGFRIEYYIAGPYLCAAWNEKSQEVVYSDILNIDAFGEIHSTVITIPLKSEAQRRWHRLIGYYSLTGREAPPTLESIKTKMRNVTETALLKTLTIIEDDRQCQGCSDGKINGKVQVFLSAVKNVWSFPEQDSGVTVTAIMNFYGTDFGRRKRAADAYRNYWEVVDKYMRESLVEVLELDEADSSVVSISQAGKCTDIVRYIEELKANITLTSSSLYKTVELSLCGYTGDPIVSATCDSVIGGGGQWNISINACEQQDITETTQSLRTISLIPTNSDNVINVLNTTSVLVGGELNAADITYAAEILTNARGIPLYKDEEVYQYLSFFTETVDRLLDANESAIDVAQRIAHASTRVLLALENLTSVVIEGGNMTDNVFEMVGENLAYKLTLQPDINGVILLEEKITPETIVYVNSNDAAHSISYMNESKVAALYLKDRGFGAIRKSFIVFGSTKLHRGSGKLESIGQILSATLTAKNGGSLNISSGFADLVSIHYPLTISQPAGDFNLSDVKCGFWNVDSSDWSTRGCLTTANDVNGVLCSCNHLTDFSVLLDIHREGVTENTQKKNTLKAHYKILSVISYIGLSVSIASLGLVVLSATLYRQFRRHNLQKVLVLLSLCLLGRDITFVVGIERTETYVGCIVVAVTLHYFLLTSFAWMFVEAILQYLRIVQVFNTYIPRFMRKSMIGAFGAPAVVVGVTLAVNVELYKASDDFCWLKVEAIYYAVLIPVGLVLLANTVVFVMVTHALTRGRKKTGACLSAASERKESILYLNTSIAVFVILGVTWVFGYLALVKDSSIIFQYLFCIFNSTQGLLIFIFHNIREPSVRAGWKKMLRMGQGQEKTHFSPTSNTNTTNSSNSEEKYQLSG